jgi:outer membrane usher protein
MKRRSALRGRRSLTARSTAGLLSVLLCMAASASGAADAAGALPPLAGAAAMPAGKLYLELVVNERSTGRIVVVEYLDGHYHVQPDDLRAVHVRVDGNIPVALERLPEVRFEYDSIGQRMKLDVPPQWLPCQQVAGHVANEFVPAASDFGGLFNYNVYASMPSHGHDRVSAWTELRLFGAMGRIASTGVLQRTFGAAVNSSADNSRYLRYDTNWIYSDQRNALTYGAGDLLTPTLAWSNAVRLGGVQVARTFGVRPDLVTYPMPHIAGQAAVPSTVDLFVNGYKASSTELQSGPFVMTNMPFINGAGSATVVTTDALGRQVSTTLPFYVSSRLLKKQLTDYALSVGALRQDYGSSNFSYGRAVSSGYLRYGLTDALTAESHVEVADGLSLLGAGAVGTLGRFGIANLALSASRNRTDDKQQPGLQPRTQQGRQLMFGYRYDSHRVNVGWQHLQRSPGFADLSTYDMPGYQLSRRSEQVTASTNVGVVGNLAAGYFDISAADGSRSRLLNLSLSRPAWGHGTLFVSANKNIGSKDYSIQLQWLMPIGKSGTLSMASSKSGGSGAQQVGYSQPMSSSGGLGWNVGYARADAQDAYRQLGVQWRNDKVQLGGGRYGAAGNDSSWAEASGSVIMMDGSAFAANRVSDAFVLVSTDGMEGVGVRYEHQHIGSTDRNGHLLVPWASAFYPARYEIETLDLPPYIKTGQIEQRLAVAAGSGALLRFQLDKIHAASIRLHNPDGMPIKLGSVVLHQESGASAQVGWDGIAYLEQLEAVNHLTVQMIDGTQCTATFALDIDQLQIAQVGPLACR